MLRQVFGFGFPFSRALEAVHSTSEIGVLLDRGRGPGSGTSVGWGVGGDRPEWSAMELN